MQTSPAIAQSKIIRWSESPWNQSGRKEKVCGGKDLLNSQVLSSEWNTEWVREAASGDSEYGKDVELPYVIGKNALTYLLIYLFTWCVIEGQHDGMVKARRYFSCRPQHGIFTTASMIRFIPIRRWYASSFVADCVNWLHLKMVDDIVTTVMLLLFLKSTNTAVVSITICYVGYVDSCQFCSS